MSNDVKQVLVWRHDLNVRKGKYGAQMAHASQAWLVERAVHGMGSKIKFSTEEQNWFATGMSKICVRVESEQELLDIYNLALQKGLKAHIITDAGRTEFGGTPTRTAVAIGPDLSSEIDKITSTLKLY